MLIANALRATAAEENLSAVDIAAKARRSELTARKYQDASCIPPGDVLLKLMVELPGFARRLGFEAVARAS